MLEYDNKQHKDYKFLASHLKVQPSLLSHIRSY